MGRGRGPVGRVGHSEHLDRPSGDLGRDEHGLVAGQDRLAKSHLLAARVFGQRSTGPLCAVVLVGQGFFNLAIVVAVEAAVHAFRVGVRS